MHGLGLSGFLPDLRLVLEALVLGDDVRPDGNLQLGKRSFELVGVLCQQHAAAYFANLFVGWHGLPRDTDCGI